MAKSSIIYECSNCGKQYSKWMGKCTECDSWNTISEKIISSGPLSKTIIPKVEVLKLKDINVYSSSRIITGDTEIDKMFGGGIVKDSVNVLSAPPGTGKSTFALHLAGVLSKLGYSVLYASREESESQIKNRANRIIPEPEMIENLYIDAIPQGSFEQICGAIEACDPSFIIFDSIQTMWLERCLPARASSPTQINECTSEIINLCKDKNKPRACIIIGQMIKDDELAGPRQMEHAVDAVFYLNGDPYDSLRICTSSKNRFGEIETAFFNMSEGMSSVTNPSEYLLTKRSPGEEVSGCALSVIKEGTRALAVEVESLTSRSFTPYPSRLGEGLKKEQLNILVSILEQHTSINLFTSNVIVKGSDGVKLQENSVNLAILMSIASSFYKKPLPCDTVFVGDMSLTGEVRKVQSVEAKIKEAERLGFKEIVIPNQEVKGKHSIKIVKVKTIKEAITLYVKA